MVTQRWITPFCCHGNTEMDYTVFSCNGNRDGLHLSVVMVTQMDYTVFCCNGNTEMDYTFLL